MCEECEPDHAPMWGLVADDVDRVCFSCSSLEDEQGNCRCDKGVK